MRFEPLDEWIPVPLCREARGPRSRVFCEVPIEHHDGQPHAGRGRFGQWFFWPTAAGSGSATEGGDTRG